jgi:hypothetical protein
LGRPLTSEVVGRTHHFIPQAEAKPWLAVARESISRQIRAKSLDL